MNCVLGVKIFLVFIFLEMVLGELWYEAQFTDSILTCDNFKNDNIEADGIKMGMTDGCEEEDPGFGLSGPLVINTEMDDGLNVNMNIFKATEVGEEYMFKSCVSLCESMKDKDAPWWPLFQMMNITSCPIPKGSYDIKNLVISIEPFSDLLSRDFCGEYSIELTLVKDLDTKVSCHLVQVAVVEHEN